MPTRATKTPVKKTTAKKPAVRKTAKKVAVTTAPVHKPAHQVKRTYIFAVGRRKEAVARVRLHPDGQGEITVNNRALTDYFPTFELQYTVNGPMTLAHQEKQGSVTAKVSGGGIQGQADAVRLGIARALVKSDPDLRMTLKHAGYLHRDPRVKERKKYGLKRARRAPQWQKR